MNYVTYDQNGKLTGAYLQDLHPSHANNHIEVTDAVRLNWVQYQANAARDGVELAPVVPPVPVIPKTVSMRQARLALYQVGKLAAVTSAINAAGEEAKLTWEYSSEVNRYDGLVPAMAASLGMTQADLDNLFLLAATK